MGELKKLVKGTRRDRLQRKMGEVKQFGKERKSDVKEGKARARVRYEREKP